MPMTDLDRAFRTLDSVKGPPLCSEILRRLESTESAMPAGNASPSRSSRVAVIALAFAVFAGAAFFGWRAFESVEGGKAATSPSPPGDPWPSVPGGWSKLPSPPTAYRGSAFVWTGTELLLWGGA